MAAKKPTKKKTTRVKVGPVEELRLGPIAAATKRKMTPAQWKAIVAEAHKRGFAINSFLDPSLPDPLKQRTKESLTSQATKTITDSYAPARKMLDDREAMIKAIDAKRASDNKYYQDWLAGKMAELNTSAGLADEKLRSTVAASQQATQDAYKSLGGNIAATATSVPGTVSNPNESTAINQGVGNQAQRALGSSEIQGNFINEQISQRQQDRVNHTANMYAQQAAAEAKRVSDTWKQLKDVGDTRQSLLFEQGQKIADEISRLLDNETVKAQNNRNYALQAAALNIKDFSAQASAAAAAAKVKETHRHNTVAEQLAQSRVNISQGMLDVAEGNLDLGWYKARHGGKGKGAKGTGTNATDPQARFETAYAGLATATRGKQKKRYDQQYVREHRDQIINGLIAEFKLTREMALRVVKAFISNGGSDPGSYKKYGPPGTAHSQYAGPPAPSNT